jgi:energy-coupling factor transporter transmembrane protein EcfT
VTPHPRTSLALAAAGLLASLVGWRSAVVALACLALLGPSLAPRLGMVLLSLAGSSLWVLILLPFAPQSVVDVAVRGLAASLTLVLVTAGVTWSRAVAELQQLGLPRTGVAFLALVARHVEVLVEAARRAVDVLKVRGALDRKAQIPGAVSVLLSRLLVLAWLRADRVADAMTLRGFDGRLPANPPWSPCWREIRSYALAALMVAVAAWEAYR